MSAQCPIEIFFFYLLNICKEKEKDQKFLPQNTHTCTQTLCALGGFSSECNTVQLLASLHLISGGGMCDPTNRLHSPPFTSARQQPDTNPSDPWAALLFQSYF